MPNFKYIFLFVVIVFNYSCKKDAPAPNQDPIDVVNELYFPPAAHEIWNDTSVIALGWNEDKLAELVEFVEEKDSRGFIILVDGKIAVEEYFNNHTVDNNWNWFSADKSLTAALVGIAATEGVVDIEDKTSTYLGEDWSTLTQEKQDLIKIKHHITMTTGLQNNISDFTDWTCLAQDCMNYEADAGTRWSYHQGAYTLTQNILTNATGLDFQEYCKQKLQDRIGMNGTWSQLLDVRIFFSTTRSMARFGLLALNEGEWNGETIYSKEYFNGMVNTSQNLNKSYGYLWWLNGKESSLTASANQSTITGSLIPNAPDDMFAALGLDDQKIYVIPSKNMVVVRCGENAGPSDFANSSFDNDLWALINDVIE